MLQKRCGECHLGAKAKSGLRIDDLAGMLHDEEIVAFKPGDSPVVQRMALATSDDNRMPPPERAPAEAWETEAVSAWIARGAAADTRMAKKELPPLVANALSFSAAPESARSATAPAPGEAVTPNGVALPPGAVVPPRASGCGACLVGAAAGEPRDGAYGLSLALVLGVLAVGRGARRRRSRANN